jgi:hypothetical protein
MNTQEAQTLVNNWKGSKDDPKYLEAKEFLEAQQVKEEPKKKKTLKERLVMTPEEMQEMTGKREDVQNGARRAQIANPSVGVVDRVMNNVTGRNEDLLDPWATKAKDLNPDGSMKEKEFALGNEANGNFIGAEEKETNEGGNAGNGSSGSSSGKTKLDNRTQTFLDKNNAIANTQEDNEYDRQKEELFKRWDMRNANIDKMSKSMKNIDDHMLEQVPTFLFKRYANGEFGYVSDTSTPEGKESKKNAQLRLAHFLLNGVASKLKQASNIAMKTAGKAPMFDDTTSDYEKYQQSNFAKGMENRWRKYEADTQSAIDVAKQGGMSEEAVTDSIATISSNNRLQSAFNQMNERQKVFALQVVSELGDKLGNMNDEQFANTLMAMAYSGNSLDYKEAAGMLIYRFMKDPEKRDKALDELGFGKGGALIKGLTKD